MAFQIIGCILSRDCLPPDQDCHRLVITCAASKLYTWTETVYRVAMDTDAA